MGQSLADFIGSVLRFLVGEGEPQVMGQNCLVGRNFALSGLHQPVTDLADSEPELAEIGVVLLAEFSVALCLGVAVPFPEPYRVVSRPLLESTALEPRRKHC